MKRVTFLPEMLRCKKLEAVKNKTLSIVRKRTGRKEAYSKLSTLLPLERKIKILVTLSYNILDSTILDILSV